MIGISARSAGGRLRAAAHCVWPTYDWPNMPTVPSDHGWLAIHAIASSPSAASSWNGTQVPVEPPQPRASCTTTA